MKPTRLAGIGLAILLSMAGCQKPDVWVDPFRVDLLLPPWGEVVYVRASYQYVVLKSSSTLRPGEEWELMREQRPVARVRTTGQRQGSFWAADILEGQPEVGDVIRP